MYIDIPEGISKIQGIPQLVDQLQVFGLFTVCKIACAAHPAKPGWENVPECYSTLYLIPNSRFFNKLKEGTA